MPLNNKSRIRYKNATTPAELKNIFDLRYRRLVLKEKSISSDQIYDDYDGIGFNFYAFTEEEAGNALGTIRIVDERDLRRLNGNQRNLYIENFDIVPHKGESPIMVGRLVTSPDKPKGVKVQPGLFGCVYVYGSDYDNTDLFIVANCEIPPGTAENPKIPKSYLRLGLEPIGKIRKKTYDDFNVHSVPMHASRKKLRGGLIKRTFFFEPMRKFISFQFIDLEDRMRIYREAIKELKNGNSHIKYSDEKDNET